MRFTFKLDNSQPAASIQTSGFCAFLERAHLHLLKYWRRILANINLTSTDEELRRFPRTQVMENPSPAVNNQNSARVSFKNQR